MHEKGLVRGEVKSQKEVVVVCGDGGNDDDDGARGWDRV